MWVFSYGSHCNSYFDGYNISVWLLKNVGSIPTRSPKFNSQIKTYFAVFSLMVGHMFVNTWRIGSIPIILFLMFLLFSLNLFFGGVADEVIAEDWKSLGVGAVPTSSTYRDGVTGNIIVSKTIV